MENPVFARGDSLKHSSSFNYYKTTSEEEKNKSLQQSWNNEEFGFSGSDRRFAYTRLPSFRQSIETPHTPISINDSIHPLLSRSVSEIDKTSFTGYPKFETRDKDGGNRFSILMLLLSVSRIIRSGNRPMKRLFIMISLNVAYSSAELFVGVFTGRVVMPHVYPHWFIIYAKFIWSIDLVSDAFHLTFGCGLLTFSLFAMASSRQKPDEVYTYGYKRLEVLSAFTNALFLLFLSFSLAVEALHAFVQDESEHKHYLIISAVTNLLVNLLGVWFFRSYARINLVYRKPEDMNYHSICLHVLADSIRSAGLILASWLLTLGVKNAEVLCLGLVSVTVFMLVQPLFRTTGGILLQMAPPNIPSSALSKCHRQICALEDVSEVIEALFWELVPGHVVGSLSIQVKKGVDDHPVLQYIHGLYHDIGIHDLTIQTDGV